jgi:hypothetical protein
VSCSVEKVKAGILVDVGSLERGEKTKKRIEEIIYQKKCKKKKVTVDNLGSKGGKIG